MHRITYDLESSNKKALSKTLRSNGIVIIKKYLNVEECEEIKSDINSVLEDGIRTAGTGMEYGDMARANEPILNQRSGDRDDGMIDIFHLDLAIPKLQNVKEDVLIQDIISRAAQEKYTPESLNVYVNKSVKNTRNYHADTYDGKFKSFVYLTDVPDVSYGPFSYIKGSHQPSWTRRNFRRFVNMFRSAPRTNAIFYNDKYMVRCTAPKGTLIIANQSGLHRGIPQEEGRERIMVATHHTSDE